MIKNTYQERILIKNFCGIQELDIELGDINIFIGKQSSGKSVLVKLIYYFREVIKAEIFANSHVYRIEVLRQGDTAENWLTQFGKYFPVESTGPFMIEYENGVTKVKIQQRKGGKRPLISYSKNILEAQVAFRKTLLNETNSDAEADSLFNEVGVPSTYFSKRLGSYFSDGCVFIPAGRSFFAVLSANIFSFISTGNSLDPIITAFGKEYQNATNWWNTLSRLMGSKDAHAALNRETNKILQSEYRYSRTGDYLIHTDGRRVSLNMASSGQQELMPLLLVLNSIRNGHVNKNVVIIEEPEAHLFPEAQSEVIDLICEIHNASPIATKLFITTHSPYILTAINSLIQAGIVKESLHSNKNKLNKLYKIVSKGSIIQSDSVRAFSMQDGTAVSILDPDTGLIDASYIDMISQRSSEQFDEMLDLL